MLDTSQTTAKTTTKVGTETMTDDIKLSKRIKDIGYTQEKLAKELNVSTPSISHVCMGKASKKMTQRVMSFIEWYETAMQNPLSSGMLRYYIVGPARP